ncbi:MAG: hypothetical protein AAF363_13240 [Bacteroidota bacterium]
MKKSLALLFLYFLCFSIEAQHQFYIELNDGNTISNDPNIKVIFHHARVHDKEHTEMRLSTSENFDKAQWQSYSKNTSYKIGKEGNHTVYAQLKDSDGELSAVASTQISMDFTKPENVKITIDEGNEYTREKSGKVELILNADGATKMQIANDSSFQHHSHWKEYQPETTWKLEHPHKDGVKNVFARFKDDAGNVSETVKAVIILDTEAPQGTIIINNNDEYTFSRLVYLTINTDAEDVDEVRIVGPRSQVFEYMKGTGDAGPNSMLQVWWLDSIVGQKIVKVWFKDKAGNISASPVVDDIKLSLDHPNPPKVKIDDDTEYCTDERGIVKLNIASDENGRYEMMISNDPNFTNAEKIGYLSTYPNWKLDTSEDGKKKVFVKVFSKSGSSSDAGFDEIIYYSKKPKPVELLINRGQEWTNKALVRVDVKAENAQFYQVSNNPGFTSARDWKSVEKPVPWRIQELDGENIVYARFKDFAGNVSETISSKINYDTEIPEGKIVLDNNAKKTSKPIVDLNIQYSDDVTQVLIGNDVSFSNSSWEDVTRSRTWKLLSKPGKKSIYYRFKDRAGNISVPKRLLVDLVASNQ